MSGKANVKILHNNFICFNYDQKLLNNYWTFDSKG